MKELSDKEKLGNDIDAIASKIRCPECGDSFSPSNDLISGIVPQKEQNKKCKEFTLVLSEKLSSVRVGNLSLSELQTWAQKYMQ